MSERASKHNRVMITGSSGYIGSQLVKRLLTDPNVEVVGLDRVEPGSVSSPRFQFVCQDVEEGIDAQLREQPIDAIFHLAFPLEHTRDSEKLLRLAHDATLNILESAKKHRVGYVSMMSSTTVYGAYANSRIHDEAATLNPNEGYTYAIGKAVMEKTTIDWLNSNDLAVSIVRPCTVIGLEADNYIVRDVFQTLPIVDGHNPRMQFLYDSDLMDALLGLQKERVTGTFNITPSDQGVERSEIHRLFGMSEEVASLERVWSLLEKDWSSQKGNLHPAILNLIAYEWLGSNDALRTRLGWEPRFSSIGTLLQFSKKLRGRLKAVR